MMNDQRLQKEWPTKAASHMERKSYATPTLFNYGNVAKLTHGTGGSKGDAGGAMTRAGLRAPDDASSPKKMR